MSSYFSVSDNSKLRLKQQDSSDSAREIDDFKTEFQGTLDIAAALYGVNKDDVDELYEHTKAVNKDINVTRKTASAIDIKKNRRVRIDRFIKCGSLIEGSTNQYTNPTVLETETSPYEIDIDLQSIDQWEKNTRIYFSNQLELESKENLLKAKAGVGIEIISEFQGCKMTFMIDSKIYYDSKNEILRDPLPLKIFNFCYPDFNYFEGSNIRRTDVIQITNALQEMIRINLLAIIDEAQKQEKPLPFIIPAPGSFFSEVSDENKQLFMMLIQDSIKQMVKQYEPLVKKHISEFILIGQDGLWSEDFKDCAGITFHKAKSDMIEIAKALKSQGVTCPIPMMAHPSHGIGNGFLSVLRTTPVDEMLARASGNIHGICFAKSILETDRAYANQTHFRNTETDQIFKTLKTNYFRKLDFTQDPNSSRVYFSKNNYPQHMISVEGDLVKQCIQIDVAPMFSLAIKQAVKGLDLFAGFENDLDKARYLKFLLDFARQHKGVGNKIAELRSELDGKIDDAYTEENRRDKENFIKKFCSQAQTLSYRFQIAMDEYGIKTGNARATKQVGARLHRLACKTNIQELFENTVGNVLFIEETPRPAPRNPSEDSIRAERRR